MRERGEITQTAFDGRSFNPLSIVSPDLVTWIERLVEHAGDIDCYDIFGFEVTTSNGKRVLVHIDYIGFVNTIMIAGITSGDFLTSSQLMILDRPTGVEVHETRIRRLKIDQYCERDSIADQIADIAMERTKLGGQLPTIERRSYFLNRWGLKPGIIKEVKCIY